MTLHRKAGTEKRGASSSCGAPAELQVGGRRLGRLVGRRSLGVSVSDDALELGQVVLEASAAERSQAAEGLRAFPLLTLAHLDEAGLVEDLDMPAEVAVGEGAELLQLAEE